MRALFDWRVYEAEVADPANHIDFTPVPRERTRKRGWSPERQRLFIFALSRCGSVARAARSVGMSPQSAFRLVHAPGAEDFVRAWDLALDEGVSRVHEDAMRDALGSTFIPVFRRGKLVRVEYRHNNRLALALLSGKEHNVNSEARRTAKSRREYWFDIHEYDAVKADCKRRGLSEERTREALHAVTSRAIERIELRAAVRGGRISEKQANIIAKAMAEAQAEEKRQAALVAEEHRKFRDRMELDRLTRRTTGPRIVRL